MPKKEEEEKALKKEDIKPKRPRGRPKGSTGPYKPRVKKKKSFMTVKEIAEILPGYKRSQTSLKKARFAAEYVSNGLNGSMAYQVAVNPNLSYLGCQKRASKWLHDPEVREMVAKWMESWIAIRKERMEKQLLEVLHAQAFYDPADFFNLDGSIAFDSWDSLPKHLHCCVVSIKAKVYGTQVIRKENTETGELELDEIPKKQITLELVDRDKAVEKLAKYIQMFQADTLNLNFIMTKDTETSLETIFSPSKALAGSASMGLLTRMKSVDSL